MGLQGWQNAVAADPEGRLNCFGGSVVRWLHAVALWTLGVGGGTQVAFHLWSCALTTEAVFQTDFRANEDCGTPAVRTAAVHVMIEGPVGLSCLPSLAVWSYT